MNNSDTTANKTNETTTLDYSEDLKEATSQLYDVIKKCMATAPAMTIAGAVTLASPIALCLGALIGSSVIAASVGGAAMLKKADDESVKEPTV